MVREGGAAPGLWWAELRNVLIMAERRSRITEPRTAAALAAVEALAIELDHTPNGEDTLRLARRHRLSVYDALYLELALRKRAPLATLDRRLSLAATSEGATIA